MMTERELQKLHRTELISLLLNAVRENEALREDVTAAEKKLSDKDIIVRDTGSIAEASIKINKVFEAAQASADQYLANIRRLEDETAASVRQKEENASAEADRLLRETTEKCGKLDAETAEKCRLMEAETAEKCRHMISEAEEECRRQEEKLHKIEQSCADAEARSAQKCLEIEEATRAKCEQALRDCEEMKKNAERDANAYWKEAVAKMEAYLDEHPQLKDKLTV
ncbi:MAG: hypothetical protein IJU30_07760 [Lachnospiraceae bacterium]|nr:hypothetical protein [Lachnospiraceae bacterium]